jgi:hypothetical protein
MERMQVLSGELALKQIIEVNIVVSLCAGQLHRDHSRRALKQVTAK